MNLYSAYSPMPASSEEKEELEKLMKDCFQALQQASKEKYGNVDCLRLRDEYKKNKKVLWFHPKAKRLIDDVMEKESHIISIYIRTPKVLYRAFSRTYKIDMADCLQEGAYAIYDAIYMYDGSFDFSTYIYWVVKNRLIHFTKLNELVSRISPAVKKLRFKVRRLIESGMHQDDAIQHITVTENLSPKFVNKLRSSIYNVRAISPLVPIKFSSHDNEEKSELWSIINSNLLSEMQKRLVIAHMEGDRKLRKKISETEINPGTGNLWTKAMLSLIFMQAMDIIRQNMKVAA